jgi:hypothetical protein
MADITVDGLDITVTQTITGIRLSNARQVERTDEGMQSNVSVTLMSGNAPLGNRKIRQAIQGNTLMTWEELNVASQASLTKDFVELTITEAQQVQGQVLATKMITAINEADVGLEIEDVNALVTTIVTALA